MQFSNLKHSFPQCERRDHKGTSGQRSPQRWIQIMVLDHPLQTSEGALTISQVDTLPGVTQQFNLLPVISTASFFPVQLSHSGVQPSHFMFIPLSRHRHFKPMRSGLRSKLKGFEFIIFKKNNNSPVTPFPLSFTSFTHPTHKHSLASICCQALTMTESS